LNQSAADLSSSEDRIANVCKQCVEIDKKIEHYRFMASRITDQPMLDGIKELIERMIAQKAALHPEQTE
jgi:hypothetical protein